MEIIVNEQNSMTLGGFIEEIYTVVFGFMIPCSLKVISKGNYQEDGGSMFVCALM